MASRDERRRLHSLFWALADSVDEAPDAGAAALVNPRDAKSEADSLRATLLAGVQTARKARLANAERELESARSAYSTRTSQLPGESASRRRMLERAVAKRPKAKEIVLTIQHRDFTELSDEDVASLLKQLAHLGLLPESEDEE